MGLHHETFTARLYQHVRPFVRLHSHASHFCTRDAYDLCRLDYLLISHFLLNLQDISAVTTDDPQRSSSLVHSTGSQISSIRFTRTIIGSLGASLRDGSLDEDSTDVEYTQPPGTSQNDKESCTDEPMGLMHPGERNITGPDGISVVVSSDLES